MLISMDDVHVVKCSTCKQDIARITLLSDSVDLRILKFHCGKCNFTTDDISWIDGRNHRDKDRADTFSTMARMNSRNVK